MNSANPHMKILLLVLMLIFSGFAKAQAYKDYEVKAAYIFRFAENIQWPDSSIHDYFRIGIYKSDTNMYASLKQIEKDRQLYHKPIQVYLYQNIDEILNHNIQLLYLPAQYNSELKNIFYQTMGSNILLVTDNIKNPIYVMINFIEVAQESISFEVNKKNIEDNNLTVLPRLLVLGGTELDVRNLYKLKEKELDDERQVVKKQAEKINSQQTLIDDQLSRINKQKEEIQNQEIHLKNQLGKINAQEKNLSKLSAEIAAQNQKIEIKEKQLRQQSIKFKEQDSLVILQKNELLNGKQILNQQKQELQKGLEQIKLQEKELRILEGKLSIQKLFLYSLFLIIILILFIVFILHRNSKSRQKLNVILQDKNDELAASEEELMQLNEQLQITNDNLYKQTKVLEDTIEKLKEAQAQLIQSEKMASVGILTSGIAHEINNPLNFIQGGKTAIELYLTDNLKEHLPQIAPLLEMINIGIVRSVKIIQSLNHFSRSTENFTEKCKLHEIIDNCLIMINHQIKHRITIEKKYTEEPYNILGNDGKLHQLFLNILTNAEQAIEDTGTISIATKIEYNKIKVLVTDSGCGIPKELLTKITDPFFTTKDPGKGTGLGLSIALSIVKEHNGTLGYKSEVNKGTTVIITLPTHKKN